MRVLAAVDGSESSKTVIDHCLNLPLPVTRIDVVHVFQPMSWEERIMPDQDYNMLVDLNREAQKKAETLLENSRAALIRAKVQNTSAHLGKGNAADIILKKAQDLGSDLIIIGNRGLNPVTRFLLGSVSETVLKKSTVPILIARKPLTTPSSVVLCYDGDESAKKALLRASTFIPSKVAELKIVNATPIHYHYGMAEAVRLSKAWEVMVNTSKSMLREAKLNLETGGLKNVDIVHLDAVNDASDAIVNYAQEIGTDLIVTGRSNKTTWEQFYLGSFSLRAARHSTASVWVEK